MNRSEWMKSQVAVWEFFYEARDVRDKSIHPATFPISLPKKCIELFTHKGELILDPFSGIGSTLIAAQDIGRNAVGFDLCQKYTDFAQSRITESKRSECFQFAICDDALNIKNYLESESVALSLSSPPYACILNRKRKNISMRGNKRKSDYYDCVQQYSNNPRDLGTMSPKKFAAELGKIYKKLLPIHKTNAHCVINITDIWWKNKRVPIHLYVITAMQKAGYELRNIIIWDRRNLVNGAAVFGWPSNYITLSTTFEYILDFRRPQK
jgi:DNA modification methylase